MSLMDELFGLLESKEFWGRVVGLVLFVAAWFGVGTNNIDPGQISDLIVAIVGALIIFDPWKLAMVILRYLGILQQQ